MAGFEFLSPFPLVECQRLLVLGLRRSNKIEGTISGVRLRARKRIFYRNSFQIQLSADLIEEGGHTRIVCRFGMRPAVIAFLIIWFGVVIFIGAGGIVGSVIDFISGSGPEALVGIFIPAMMIVFGLIILVVARYLGARERLLLTAFVRETLKASPCP
jgi:hypothetical protein